MTMTVLNSGYTSYTRTCTHGDATKVARMGKKCDLWGGSRVELMEKISGWKLIVSAVGYADFIKNPITVNKEAQALMPAALLEWSPPPCIGIDWPDRGVPRLGSEWWEELVLVIRKIKGDVGVCCLGGHGRTGTMLAIITALSGKVKKGDCPVEWVRKHYCHDAVESDGQIEYIEWVTGREVTAEPSDSLRFSSVASRGPTGVGTGANPTLPGLGGTVSDFQTPLGATTQSYIPPGSETGALAEKQVDVLDDLVPSDLELLQAMERGDGEVTALIDGTGGRRWSPVYEENDQEIVGWCEVEEAEAEELVVRETLTLPQ